MGLRPNVGGVCVRKQVLSQSRKEIHSEEKQSPERLDCGASSHIPEPDGKDHRISPCICFETVARRWQCADFLW